jgi:acyl-CoA thioesterase FadM
MASARTVWVLVDAATGRPKRIDLRLKEMFGGKPGV